MCWCGLWGGASAPNGDGVDSNAEGTIVRINRDALDIWLGRAPIEIRGRQQNGLK